MAGTVRVPARRVLDGCDPHAIPPGGGELGRWVHAPGARVWNACPGHGRPAATVHAQGGHEHMKVRCAAALAAPATLAAPAAAHASGIAVQGACFVSGAPVPLTGFGFTAGNAVSI